MRSRDKRPTRNPRYAPELLESRLNPSGITNPVVTGMDAIELSYLSALAKSDNPVIIGPPLGGTDPAPPDGDGNPPIANPNSPVGPDLPA